MNAYLNTFYALETFRKENQRGPIVINIYSNINQVLIVGPNDSGKTSLAKILLAYARKLQYETIYVDLDISKVYNSF